MALLERAARASSLDLTGTTRVVVLAATAGLLLGVGDLWAMTHLSGPWAALANSSAVWASAAFVLGACVSTGSASGGGVSTSGAATSGAATSGAATSGTAALGGVVLLLVAVESYYGFATAFGLSGLSSMWSEHARMWLVFGVAAGVVFGVAGAWTSSGSWGLRALGAAAGAGVLLGEALHTERVLIADPLGVAGGYGVDLLGTAVLMSALGMIVLGLSTREPRLFLAAAVLTVPMTVLSAIAFEAVGISY